VYSKFDNLSEHHYPEKKHTSNSDKHKHRIETA